MANPFLNIPDWFSWDNQGADIAVSDLNNDGQQALIVLMVDSPPGKNKGLYRIGRNLDQEGKVRDGWGNWIEIPDWFSFENQGAGVALADLDGDGRPELVVFMIDNPAGKNQGYYRIGKTLDANGNVTGGWGPWIPVPDWFSWENQHGSIALADLDGDGRPELVVFMIDNPVGKNQGYYRIGKTLDANGNVTGGWSPWIPVPDWFSWENQAGSLTVADLGTGTIDILAYQVDNHPASIRAFTRSARDSMRTVTSSTTGGAFGPCFPDGSQMRTRAAASPSCGSATSTS